MTQTHPIDINLRDAAPSDTASLAAIYNHYILNTIVSFEEAPVSVSEMDQRVTAVRDSSLPWLVAERGGSVVGYAYASKWRTREAYRFSAESTIYLDPRHLQTGIGSALYPALLSRLKGCGIHAVMGGIALPNDASIALHERLGFKKVAHFDQVGFKFGHWIDVGYWQRLVERIG